MLYPPNSPQANKIEQKWIFQPISLALGLSCLGWLYLTPASAQPILPDSTLGAESSAVAPGVVNGATVDHFIQGGAIRGSNLFHSFLEFNVGLNEQVYFANPGSVSRIVGRVTGNNASLIEGTLGVAGNADLYLINPNGILFGPNARLDINGSFLASTANGLTWGNGLEFNATNHQAPPLLTIDLPVSLTFAPGNTSILSSEGQLTTGADLTLAAERLELQGSLEAGGDLNLLANQQVQIRDSASQPFNATAQGDLLIQGDQGIDIFTLNHPDSWLVAGNNFTLRSDGDIIGDAHFWSSGGFTTETLSGQTANFLSPNDPIILAAGDVTLGDYTGASLHILAGGSVTLGNVAIGARGNVNDTINPNHPDAFISSLANYTLSDGTPITIDGSNGSGGALTLDIRAGIDWSQVPGFPGISAFGITGTIPPPPPLLTAATDADITIGNIQTGFPAPGSPRGGAVVLTNQYFANGLPGNISTGEIISVSAANGGGLVVIDSRERIDVGDDGRGFSIAARQLSPAPVPPAPPVPPTRDGGDIRLLAAGEITTSDQIDASGALGGNITIRTGADLDLDNVNVVSFSYTNAVTPPQGGSITLTSPGTITVQNDSEVITASRGTAQAGDITVAANRLEIINPANVPMTTSALNAQARDQGDGGNIVVNANEVFLDQGYIFANTRGDGDAGTVTINGDRLTLQANPNRNNAAPFISVASQGAGDGGQITVNTPMGITELIGTDATGFPSAFVFASFNGAAPGNLDINTQQLLVQDGALISGSTFGSQPPTPVTPPPVLNPGSITIDASDLIQIRGRGPSALGGLTLETSNATSGGSFIFNTQQFLVLDGGNVSAQTISGADAGTLQINANEVRISGESNGSGSRLFFESQNSGQGGGIDINANQVIVENGGLISVSGSGTGNSGDISITSDSVIMRSGGPTFTGGSIQTETIDANGGNIYFNNQSQIVMECCNNEITAQASGTANGGNIYFNFSPAGGRIDSPGPLTDNNDVVANAASGNGGLIQLNNFLAIGNQTAPERFTDLNGPRTPLSEFSARSISGNDGTVDIRIRDNLDLEALPEDFAGEPLSQSCTTGGRVASERERSRSTFTVTGQGGLAPGLDTPLGGSSIRVDPAPLPSADRPAPSADRDRPLPSATARSPLSATPCQSLDS